MKRFCDIIFSFIGLIILLPGLFLIGATIFICDGGPILFKQDRVGRNAILFKLYKFRSMRVRESNTDVGFEPGDTSRITWIGKFIRKTKVDELPQLINVLKGDMSFVGPRPEVKEWISVYPASWEKVLKVRPGITDNASLEFRNEEQILAKSSNPKSTYIEEILPRKLELNEKYVDDHNLLEDLRIIFKTFYFVFIQRI